MEYREKVIASVAENCRRRRISVDELGDVLGFVEERQGKTISEMIEPDLRRVQRNLPATLDEYLDGAKRVDVPAAEVLSSEEYLEELAGLIDGG